MAGSYIVAVIGDVAVQEDGSIVRWHGESRTGGVFDAKGKPLQLPPLLKEDLGPIIAVIAGPGRSALNIHVAGEVAASVREGQVAA